MTWKRVYNDVVDTLAMEGIMEPLEDNHGIFTQIDAFMQGRNHKYWYIHLFYFPTTETLCIFPISVVPTTAK